VQAEEVREGEEEEKKEKERKRKRKRRKEALALYGGAFVPASLFLVVG
jgi:hypothetical protein